MTSKSAASAATTASAMANKPLLSAFLLRYDAFCVENNLPFRNNCPDNDFELADLINEKSYSFVEDYIETHLYTREKQYDVILEYGMKKLIYLKCEYDGEEILDELLDFDQYIDQWLHLLLMNVANVY